MEQVIVNHSKELEILVGLGGIILFDGATGTELMKKGLKGCNEFHNINHPDEVKAVAKAYFDAGSDVILTNTFQGSDIALRKKLEKYTSKELEKYNPNEIVYETNKAGAELAVSTKPTDSPRPGGAFVIASIGPTGKIRGRVPIPEIEVIAAYKPQIEGVRDGGVDAIALETFLDLDELLYAIKAVKCYSNLRCICSMTFDKTPRGEYATKMGVRIPYAAEALINQNPIAIGSNCGNGIDNMIEIMKEYSTYFGKGNVRLYAKPNAGNPKFINGRDVYQQTPEEFSRKLPALLDAGASLVGGCCGTGPEHIIEMRKVLDNRK